MKKTIIITLFLLFFFLFSPSLSAIAEENDIYVLTIPDNNKMGFILQPNARRNFVYKEIIIINIDKVVMDIETNMLIMTSNETKLVLNSTELTYLRINNVTYGNIYRTTRTFDSDKFIDTFEYVNITKEEISKVYAQIFFGVSVGWCIALVLVFIEVRKRKSEEIQIGDVFD